MLAAAHRLQLARVPLHRSQGCVWAGAGCLPAILWLRGEGLWLCGEDCLAAAARWWPSRAAGGAVEARLQRRLALLCLGSRGGHLLTLMVARRLGFVWDEMVCANAAGAGALDVLRWARSPDFSALPSLPSLLCSPASSPLASRTGSPSTSPPISPARRHRSIHSPHAASVATIPSHHVASPASTTSTVIPDSRLRYTTHVNYVLGSASASRSDDGGGTRRSCRAQIAAAAAAAGARALLVAASHALVPRKGPLPAAVDFAAAPGATAAPAASPAACPRQARWAASWVRRCAARGDTPRRVARSVGLMGRGGGGGGRPHRRARIHLERGGAGRAPTRRRAPSRPRAVRSRRRSGRARGRRRGMLRRARRRRRRPPRRAPMVPRARLRVGHGDGVCGGGREHHDVLVVAHGVYGMAPRSSSGLRGGFEQIASGRRLLSRVLRGPSKRTRRSPCRRRHPGMAP